MADAGGVLFEDGVSPATTWELKNAVTSSLDKRSSATPSVNSSSSALVASSRIPLSRTNISADAMRRILIEQARRHHSLKRGGGWRRVLLEQAELLFDERAEELFALDEALEKLEARDKRKNEIVMLRYFAGLTIEETANILRISLTTVKDKWKFAKAWLHSEIAHGNKPGN